MRDASCFPSLSSLLVGVIGSFRVMSIVARSFVIQRRDAYRTICQGKSLLSMQKRITGFRVHLSARSGLGEVTDSAEANDFIAATKSASFSGNQAINILQR